MGLERLKFTGMSPTPVEAHRLAHTWFPEISGSIEARSMIFIGRAILATIALHVRRTTPNAADMRQVRVAIDLISVNSDITLFVPAALSENEIIPSCSGVRISQEWGYDEGIAFLRLNIVDWRAQDLEWRWPSEWNVVSQGAGD